MITCTCGKKFEFADGIGPLLYLAHREGECPDVFNSEYNKKENTMNNGNFYAEIMETVFKNSNAAWTTIKFEEPEPERFKFDYDRKLNISYIFIKALGFSKNDIKVYINNDKGNIKVECGMVNTFDEKFETLEFKILKGYKQITKNSMNGVFCIAIQY